MNTVWGVYNMQGKLADGEHVEADDRRSVRWFIRWRVDGRAHKRTFKQKGYATTWLKQLQKAQLMGWPADARGWPLSPTEDTVPAQDAAKSDRGPSFEEYCTTEWYPTAKGDWSDSNRIGHRHNMRLSIKILRYQAGDRRLAQGPDLSVGDSILMADLVPDDVLRAIAVRKRTNGRTAAVNERRIASAYDAGSTAIDLLEEVASVATVRAFYVTLAMILRSAHNSELTARDPLTGTSKKAPKPRQARISQRIVPSIDEVFDLSEAIAQLGPLMDGRPAGERFRSLILCGGTLAPRPGELTAHRPEWIEWDDTVIFRFEKTESAIYDPEEGVRGRQVRPLKHRTDDDVRPVPVLAAVADSVRLHMERGYCSPERTWTSATGTAGLDWHNLIETYWLPACRKVFAGSSKSQLVTMSPGILRKAAITFWLDSGISPYLAAEWAGHSEDVSKRYYAGRASVSFVQEVELLAAHRTVGNHAGTITGEPQR